MTKQEEIKEGIANLIPVNLATTSPNMTKERVTKNILAYLASQGVVIKVERGHDSDCAVHNEPAYPAGECDCRVLPVGCVAVEPLIGGGKGEGMVDRDKW